MVREDIPMEKGAWPRETCHLVDRNLWVLCLRVALSNYMQ